MLEGPTNKDLCRILAVFLGEFLQHGILKLSPDEGSVCLNYDAMRAAVVNDGPLLTVRVELYLIDGGQFESCFGDFFQVFNIVVGYPYRLELARFLGGQKCFPALKADSLSPVGTVYEIEIEIIKAKISKRIINSIEETLVTTGNLMDFGR